MRLTPALVRALDIMELFAEEPRLSTNDVVARTGFPKTSVHELMYTLTQRGYLQRQDNSEFSLGPRTAFLGRAFTNSFDFLTAVTEVARSLADATGHTSSAGVRQGQDVFYLAKIDGREQMSLISSVGRRVPASCTGLGKALLATLSDDEVRKLYADAPLPILTEHSLRSLDELLAQLAVARERGYATEHGESGPHVSCIAVPILTGDGQALGALSISLPTSVWESKPEEHWAKLIKDAGHELHESLAFL